MRDAVQPRVSVPMHEARVLVVDDSAAMRALFSDILDQAKNVTVVGTARSADDARDQIAELKPNVITLDVMRELDEAIDELATSLAEPTDAVTEAQVRPLVQQLVQQLLREYVTLHDFERLTGRIDASEEKAQAFRERVLADTAVILDRVKRTRPAGG